MRADWLGTTLRSMSHELRAHVPFTVAGTLLGVGIMAAFVYGRVPHAVSETLFWILHPAHVLLSAAVTTGIYRLHSKGTLWTTILIGYFGAIGVATLSDCVIPYVGEFLLDLPNSDPHIGFIEKWWLVNPLALIGIAIAYVWPQTKFPHAGHVLLSTWASLFHVTMALGEELSIFVLALVAAFLFAAVWVPCCTSDILFPLLFAEEKTDAAPPKQSGPG